MPKDALKVGQFLLVEWRGKIDKELCWTGASYRRWMYRSIMFEKAR